MLNDQELRELINAPEMESFLRGVHIEAVHQVDRWGEASDRGKRPEDWFWLVGYLAGKALAAHKASLAEPAPTDGMDMRVIAREKALHHCISTAAALYNWHCAITGTDVRMAPGDSDVARIVEGAFPGSTDEEAAFSRFLNGEINGG